MCWDVTFGAGPVAVVRVEEFTSVPRLREIIRRHLVLEEPAEGTEMQSKRSQW